MSLKRLLDVFSKENKFQSFHLGEVVDNKDPLKIGRVKINIPNFTEGIENDILPWSHQIFPIGTGGDDAVPTFKVPAIGTNVVVIFPTDDIYSSFYIGELIFKKHKLEELLSDYPETYGFIDKIKNKYWVNLKKGTVDIHHHSGTHLNIEKDGTINVDGVKDLNINIKGNSTVKIGGDAKLDISGKFDVTTGGTYSINAGGNFSVNAPNIFLN